MLATGPVERGSDTTNFFFPKIPKNTFFQKSTSKTDFKNPYTHFFSEKFLNTVFQKKIPQHTINIILKVFV